MDADSRFSAAHRTWVAARNRYEDWPLNALLSALSPRGESAGGRCFAAAGPG